MKIKLTLILYVLILIVIALLLFQIEIPMCYNLHEREAPITFITYDEEVVAQVKQEITESLFYFIRISGHSMQPAIKHNDMCVCIPKRDYDEGDVVSFYVPVEEDKVELIAHRINKKNGNQFLTKGDNNDIKDNWIISEEQIFCQIPEKNLFDKFKFAIIESGGKFSVFSIFR